MIIEIITALTAMVKFADAVSEVGEEEDSNEEVLDRIDTMQEALENQIDKVGEAITNLTHIVEEGFDSLKLETAKAAAVSAMNLLYTYSDLGLESALTEADGYSSNAVALMLQQDELYFIGGLILAGNVRIDVIRALDPEFSTDDYRIQEINALADHLERFIVRIEQRVPQYHHAYERERSTNIMEEYEINDPDINKLPPPRVTKEMVYRRFSVIKEKYAFSCQGTACQLVDLYSKAEATQLANAARDQGILDELAGLAVPQMREILSIWRGLVVQQQTGISVWRFLERKLIFLDAQRAKRTYLTTTREPVFKTARSGEEKVKPQLSLETHVDARAFVTDMLLSQEFKTKCLTKLDKDDVYNELFKRLFNRTTNKDEQLMLRHVEDELGLDGLIAGLVYGKEYQQKFGTGFPLSRNVKLPAKKTTSPAKKKREVLATTE